MILVMAMPIVGILVAVAPLVCQLIMPIFFGLGRGFTTTYTDKNSDEQRETQDQFCFHKIK